MQEKTIIPTVKRFIVWITREILFRKQSKRSHINRTRHTKKKFAHVLDEITRQHVDWWIYHLNVKIDECECMLTSYKHISSQSHSTNEEKNCEPGEFR